MFCALIIFPSLALASDVTDQVCYGDPLGQGRAVPIRFTLHGQVFKPTVSHISKIAIFARSTSGDTAKAKVKIERAWWGWSSSSYEKTIVINKDPWWVEVDFGEAPVTAGSEYFLTVEPLNNSAIDWYINDSSSCNPAGYAFVGGNIERDKDFYFLTRGNSDGISLQQPVGEAAEETPSASDPNNTANTNSSNIIGGASPIASGSPSSRSSSNSSSSKSTNAYVPDSEIAASNKVSGNNSGISDEEVEQILKMIADDYAKRKRGMFGLSGAVGSFLTPTVFYSILGLILAIIVILIVVTRKRKDAGDSGGRL